MGSYINTPSNKGKTEFIIKTYCGILLPLPPNSFADIPEGKALVVVVDNGHFQAAGYAYSEGEFRVFTDPNEKRHRDYILLDKVTAELVASLALDVGPRGNIVGLHLVLSQSKARYTPTEGVNRVNRNKGDTWHTHTHRSRIAADVGSRWR